jgi:hypothetical protein
VSKSVKIQISKKFSEQTFCYIAGELANQSEGNVDALIVKQTIEGAMIL